ncbi:MAG: hypothetical protein ACFFB5_04725 [Promethearchaeota archaeon]
MKKATNGIKIEEKPMEQISDLLKRHTSFIVLITIIYFFSAITVLIMPKGFEISQLTDSYILFGPSLSAIILLLTIGGYLVYRYLIKPSPRKESMYQLIWGVSFLLYSITFIGMCIQSLGFQFADMDDPFIFLLWRNPMILWATGMFIGTMMLFTEDKKVIYIPALIILLAGEFWFSFRLVLFVDANSIEQTMYGFLFGEFIPVSVLIAYLFYSYGKNSKLSSAWMLTIGFSLLSLTYAAWAPWHFSDLRYIYFIWFDLFLVSLAFILTGFFALPKEIMSKLETEEY